MTPIHFPTEDEIRQAYQQGEEAIVALFREMILNIAYSGGTDPDARRSPGQE